MTDSLCRLTQDGFGIHTFMLIKQLKFDEYKYLMTLLTQYRHIPKDKFGTTTSFIVKDNGINGLILRLQDYKSQFKELQIIVNPRCLIDNENKYIDIFSTDRYTAEQVETEFNTALSIVNINYTFQDFSMSRIDLCVNFIFYDNAIVEQYIKIAKKAIIQKDFEIDTFNKNEKNYIEKNKHSVTIHNDKLEFSIYDKLFQMDECGCVDKNADKYDGLMRVEFRLNREIILSAIKQNKLTTNTDIIQYFADSSANYFGAHIKDIFFKGDYAPLSEARKIITDSISFKKTRKRMLSLVNSQYKFNNIDRAYKTLQDEENLTKEKVNVLINNFMDLDLSPTTIPVRDYRATKTILPGIAKLICCFAENYKTGLTL